MTCLRALCLILLAGCGPRPDLGLRVAECAGRLARDTPAPAVARTTLALADGGHPALAERLLATAAPALRADESDWAWLVIGLAWREAGAEDPVDDIADALEEVEDDALTRAHAAPLRGRPSDPEAGETLLSEAPPGHRLDLLRALTEAARGQAGAARRALAALPARHPRRDETVRRAATALVLAGAAAGAADLVRWGGQAGAHAAHALLRPLERAERWADAAPVLDMLRDDASEADALTAFIAAAPADTARALIAQASPGARFALWLARVRVEDLPDEAIEVARRLQPAGPRAQVALGRALLAADRADEAAAALPTDASGLDADEAAEAALLALALQRPEQAVSFTERAVSALAALQDPTLEAAAGGSAVAALLSAGLAERAFGVIERFPESFRPLALGLIAGRLADEGAAAPLLLLTEGAERRGWDTDALAPELARVGAFGPALRAAARAPDPVSRLAALASVAGAAQGRAPTDEAQEVIDTLCPPLPD